LSDIDPVEESRAPSVAIIVPARNEERHLESALSSLLKLDYPDYQVVVVDDRSSDRTPEILEQMSQRHRNLRRLRVDSLPQGWLGKTHALHYGAEHCQSDLLLFSDADVHFESSALKRAVGHLRRQEIDHLACIPDIRSRGWVLTILQVTFGLSFTLFQRPWKARDPKSSAYVGVGAFNLLTRQAYEGCGGLPRIALQVDDDVKLGLIVKRSGFRQDCLVADRLLWLEWYANLREMVEGLSKNAFAAFGYRWEKALGASLATLLMWVGPPIGVLLTSGWTQATLAAITLSHLALFLEFCRYLRKPLICALGYPLGFLLLVHIIARSAVLTLKQGGVIWRGTHYSLRSLRRSATDIAKEA
ncbi:MAG TPA: glycosyltransferase, partial [Acidobacteriota bacterium]|nr:glycosyltransferase [Acidobacteriota bacterium]